MTRRDLEREMTRVSKWLGVLNRRKHTLNTDNCIQYAKSRLDDLDAQWAQMEKS